MVPVEAKPFPWPWHSAPEWVDTTYVFSDHGIQRNLTTRERCQLMDAPGHWGARIDLIWAWNDGAALPLLLLVEFVLALTTSIKQVEREGREGTNLEDIAVACKKDDAEIDLLLWAVGGNEPGKEAAHEKIRRYLWKHWRRRIYKEACDRLRRCDASENIQANREAIIDCLLRCAALTWWNWDHGSRLFFWRWPPIWRYEARDGSGEILTWASSFIITCSMKVSNRIAESKSHQSLSNLCPRKELQFIDTCDGSDWCSDGNHLPI